MIAGTEGRAVLYAHEARTTTERGISNAQALDELKTGARPRVATIVMIRFLFKFLTAVLWCVLLRCLLSPK